VRFECGNPILAINEPPFTSTRRIDANSPTVNKPQGVRGHEVRFSVMDEHDAAD
jgi:hypothetical protein